MNLEAASNLWMQVSNRATPALREARALAHLAVQPVGAAGASLCETAPDDSHVNVRWEGTALRFVGSCVHANFSAALSLPELALEIVDVDGGSHTLLALEGKTFDDAYAWINDAFASILGTAPKPPITALAHELPAHEVLDGKPFGACERSALDELGRWYTNASAFCESLASEVTGASPVRCWPHHFDLATLVRLDAPGSDPETARSIGFGMSPGDSAYDEPYFYVNPWPAPTGKAPGAIGGGAHWHTAGWFGAVLSASALPADGAAQARAVQEYVTSAWRAVTALLAE